MDARDRDNTGVVPAGFRSVERDKDIAMKEFDGLPAAVRDALNASPFNFDPVDMARTVRLYGQDFALRSLHDVEQRIARATCRS